MHGFRCLSCADFGICPILRKINDYDKFKQSILYRNIEKCKPGLCATCAQAKECHIERGIPWRAWENANTRVIVSDNHIEVLRSKEDWKHLVDSVNTGKEECDRGRLLQQGEDGVLVAARPDVTIAKLKRSMLESYKRSIQQFFSYAYANDWKYWFTLTLDPTKVDRNDDEAVKEIWSRWVWDQKRTHGNPDIKLLCKPERHKPNEEYPNGAIHYHVLAGNCNLLIEPKMKADGTVMYSSFGHMRFIFKDWHYGWSDGIILPLDQNNAWAVNYMAKYMSKSKESLGYNKKEYFRTRNLLASKKEIRFITDDEWTELCVELEACGYEKGKDTEKMTRYVLWLGNPDIKSEKK
jgi:hypothetical protein